jgi:hypothetical protein
MSQMGHGCPKGSVVRQKVTVIAATTTPAALAKAATATQRSSLCQVCYPFGREATFGHGNGIGTPVGASPAALSWTASNSSRTPCMLTRLNVSRPNLFSMGGLEILTEVPPVFDLEQHDWARHQQGPEHK